jgi:hypothetical protein
MSEYYEGQEGVQKSDPVKYSGGTNFDKIYLAKRESSEDEGRLWCQDRMEDDDTVYVREDLYEKLQDRLKAQQDTYWKLSKEFEKLEQENKEWIEDRDRWFERCKVASHERDIYKKALKEIANQDYRGNRSTESVIAFKALGKEQG